MNKKAFFHLLRKYRQGTATAEERRFIESYYDLFEMEPDPHPGLSTAESDQLKDDILNGVWDKVKQQDSEHKTFSIRKRILQPVRIAAAILVLLAAGSLVYIMSHRTTDHKGPVGQELQQHINDDIRPGGNKAILTLSNGRKISLDTISIGSLAHNGDAHIRKQDNGELIYQDEPYNGGQDIGYHTITIPRGGEYKVVLADGTKVWLNAGSILHYPVTFNNSERRVTLSGEAYFEVAPQMGKTFVVDAGHAEIQVLGTHFNINTYHENRISTTLAEGAVRVSGMDKSLVLKPGQQAISDQQTRDIKVKQVNVEEALAWKNGLFHFNNTNIVSIMQEVGRWYNVEIVYATKNLDSKNFSGVMSRYSEATALLKRLELTGTVHFKMKDGKIIVMD
ncbi:FecR domain-containing protein [Chitinophaga sp. MM2321]|uniref:FecR family protein n=1 Tax=Chitinophaga sp. MM2321 TaxID=3137178 RepID=UPI0032D5788A